MRKTLSVLALTLLALLALDMAVAGVLAVAERHGKLAPLVTYFEYGRSVPGKLARWERHPDTRGNLYDVAWRPGLVADSAARFGAEAEKRDPTVRSYGMSFVRNILRAAKTQDPDLVIDTHGGPAAPPNFTFALFEDDRANRRAGDIAVLGVLSSSVPALAALSNSTWMFEQPAPFTYPVYRHSGEGMQRIDPLVESVEAYRNLDRDPAAAAAWAAQLSAEDAFYSPVTFGAAILDLSPFARLVRRSLATAHIESIKRDIVDNGLYPHAETLQRMAVRFAETARSDGQIPVVMLIQGRDRGDVDLLAIMKPTLERNDIPYLATAEHFDPRNLSGFKSDGHYRQAIDDRFGAAFLALIDRLTVREARLGD
jgi:hypothetical protein